LFVELLTLFVSSFISATLFPGGSELLLIYHVSHNPADTWIYFLVATAGNSLGALLTYFMGYYLNWGRENFSLNADSDRSQKGRQQILQIIAENIKM
jgi:membrane protein YqaA with SNARE-associated domain